MVKRQKGHLHHLHDHFGQMVHPCLHQDQKLAATSLGDTIYVIGGFDTSGQHTDIVEAYSVKDNTWSQVHPLPHALHHTAASSFNGKIYVVGGYL